MDLVGLKPQYRHAALGHDGHEGVLICSKKRTDRQTDVQSDAVPPSSLRLPFCMLPPHLQSCHCLVRTNQRMPRCLPAMYRFGQDDIKFLVLRVKDHMKTDVLITGPLVD